MTAPGVKRSGKLADLAEKWERERRERAGENPAPVASDEPLAELRAEPDDDQPWRRP